MVKAAATCSGEDEGMLFLIVSGQMLRGYAFLWAVTVCQRRPKKMF